MKQFAKVFIGFFLATHVFSSDQTQFKVGNTWLYSYHYYYGQLSYSKQIYTYKKFVILSKTDSPDATHFLVQVQDSGIQIVNPNPDTTPIFTLDTIAYKKVDSLIVKESDSSQSLELQDTSGISKIFFSGSQITIGYYVFAGERRAIFSGSAMTTRYYILGIGLLAYSFGGASLHGVSTGATEKLVAFNGFPIESKKVIDSLFKLYPGEVLKQKQISSSEWSVRQGKDRITITGIKNLSPANVLLIDPQGRRMNAPIISWSGNTKGYSIQIQQPLTRTFFVCLRKNDGYEPIQIQSIR